MSLSIPGIDWTQNERTLLLVLSNECHFCTESAPFYQQIMRQRGRAKVIAVLPQDVNSTQSYLRDHGIFVDDVKQAPLDSIGIRGTPTIVLVDSGGVVKGVWVGKLPQNEEASLLREL